MRKFGLFIFPIFSENIIWLVECAGLILTVWLLFSPAFSKSEVSKPWSLWAVMILFIQEFISLLNSYIQKTLTFHFLYNCKTVLSSWTLFRGSNFLCLTFTNSKSFDPVTGNLFERDSLIIDCLIASSLSFSFNNSIPFAITESHFMFSCLSSADFKMANSTTSLSPLSLVCCCFLGRDLTHAYTCPFSYGSDLILWEWLSLLKTPVLWLALFMPLPGQNTSETLITIIHRWWGCR